MKDIHKIVTQLLPKLVEEYLLPDEGKDLDDLALTLTERICAESVIRESILFHVKEDLLEIMKSKIQLSKQFCRLKEDNKEVIALMRFSWGDSIDGKALSHIMRVCQALTKDLKPASNRDILADRLVSYITK